MLNKKRTIKQLTRQKKDRARTAAAAAAKVAKKREVQMGRVGPV